MKMDCEPFLIELAMPRTHHAVSKFTKHDHRNCSLMLQAQDCSDFGVAIDKRRKCVRVENQLRSSGSLTSNSWSMADWMRAVSLCKRLSLPKPCIHSGVSTGAWPRSILSRNASVTNS